MPTRTVHPAEPVLIQRLISLGVGGARKALGDALRIGYNCEAVAAILDHFEGLILTDPVTGLREPAYHAGALVIRLRDDDARGAAPDHGRWGSKRGEWTALKLRLDNPVKVKPAEAERVPTKELARKLAFLESMTREQAITIVEALTEHPDQVTANRAEKCLAYIESHWLPTVNLLIPPPPVRKFLAEFDPEQILAETKE